MGMESRPVAAGAAQKRRPRVERTHGLLHDSERYAMLRAGHQAHSEKDIAFTVDLAASHRLYASYVKMGGVYHGTGTSVKVHPAGRDARQGIRIPWGTLAGVPR